ncbi:MAG: LuxR C-terminal-related transcriptional regulator [Thermomicrobiales bacterium]
MSGTWVRRPRLEARLDRAPGKLLVLIVAPAGHGKTSTIASWLDLRQQEAAWVTAYSRDADLTRFAAHIAAALDQRSPGIAPPLYALLNAPDRPGPAQLGEAFGETLYDLDRDVLLVLDDLHEAGFGDAPAFLGGLLAAAPRRLHAIIASRTPVGFPLARLRLMGEIDELTGADLRFSAEETGQLLAAESPEAVDDAAAARVQVSVGGWPAAIRLIALSGADTAEQRPVVTGGQPASLLHAYLGEEVLSRLDPGERDLLLRASLLERFNRPLLNAIASAAHGAPLPQRQLDHLRGLELFREIPGLPETWYAFHPLFREVLRGELERSLDEAAIEALRHVIAQWFAGANMVREAVRHLVALNDIPAATALIEARQQAALDTENWPAVAEWLALIPDEAMRPTPELLLAAAWVAYLSGRFNRIGAVREQMRAAEIREIATPGQLAEIALLLTDPDDEPEAMLPIVANAFQHIAPSRRYRYGFTLLSYVSVLASGGRPDDALQEASDFIERESGRIDAASIRGYFARTIVLWQVGRLAQCEQAAADQLQLAALNALPVSASWAATFLAACAYERGDFAGAAQHASAVIAKGEHAHFMAVREAFFIRALTYEMEGRRDEADRTTARLRDLMITRGSDQQLSVIAAFRARIALMRGDREAARQWLDATPATGSYGDPKSFEIPPLTRAKVLIALSGEEHLAEAELILRDLLAYVTPRQMFLARLETLAVFALLEEQRGHSDRADGWLRQALELAEPERLTMRLAALGHGLAPGLRRLRGSHPHASAVMAALHSAQTAQKRSEAARLQRAAQAAPVTPLSDREGEVLLLLAQRLTNNEIGDLLFISPITVKHHVANIAGKLGVSGRRAAVEHARQIGLVS